MEWFIENVEIARDSRSFQLHENNKHHLQREAELCNKLIQDGKALHEAGFALMVDDGHDAGDRIDVRLSTKSNVFKFDKKPSKVRVFATHNKNGYIEPYIHTVTNLPVDFNGVISFKKAGFREHSFVYAHKCENDTVLRDHVVLEFGGSFEKIYAFKEYAPSLSLDKTCLIPFADNVWLFLLEYKHGKRVYTTGYFHCSSKNLNIVDRDFRFLLNFAVREILFNSKKLIFKSKGGAINKFGGNYLDIFDLNETEPPPVRITYEQLWTLYRAAFWLDLKNTQA